MGDGCWLQFPQRLREPGPGRVLSFPPPTEYCIILCGLLAKYIQLCGIFAKYIQSLRPFGPSSMLDFFVGPVALYTLMYLKNKVIFLKLLLLFVKCKAVIVCARCKWAIQQQHGHWPKRQWLLGVHQETSSERLKVLGQSWPKIVRKVQKEGLNRFLK